MPAKSGGDSDFPPLNGDNNGGVPKPGDVTTDNNNTSESEKSKTSFANMAGRERQTQWLVLHLFREDRSISYNLSRRERALLVYKRLKVPPQHVRSIVSSGFEQVRVELDACLNVEQFKKAEAVYIRPGLKVQPMKEMKRTTRVKVCWVDLDYDGTKKKDEAIVETLSLFGKVDGEPEHLNYELTEQEMADDDINNLKNVKSGERAVEIEIHVPIPSFVKIDGKRARVWHPAQNYNCGRCYKSFRSCPGKADRAECKRLNGAERDFEDFWKEVLGRKMYKEPMKEEEEYNTDIIDIARVPKEATKEDLLALMREEEVEVLPENLIQTEFPETWRIINIKDAKVMKEIVKRCHSKKLKKKPLLFLPVQLPTPMKAKLPKVQASTSDPPPAPSSALAAEAAATSASGPPSASAPGPPTAPASGPSEEAIKRSVEKERKNLQASVKQFNDNLKKREENKKKAELVTEKERREREQEKDEGGQGGSRESVAGRATGGPAGPSGEEVETQVSQNIVDSTINTVKNFFGIVKDKAKSPIKVSKKSSTPPEAVPKIIVQETPAPAVTSKPKQSIIVGETPATSASPILSGSINDRDITIDSQDEIFGNSAWDTEYDPPQFKSHFAKDLERRHSFSLTETERPKLSRKPFLRRTVLTSERPRTNSLGMSEKRGARGSDSSQSEDNGTPHKPVGLSEEEFTKTKNQKKKEKRREAKKRKEEGKKAAELKSASKEEEKKEEATPPPKN